MARADPQALRAPRSRRPRRPRRSRRSHGPGRRAGPGRRNRAAYDVIRRTIDHLETDRILAEDIARMRTLMKSGELLDAVEAAVGKLA